MLDFLIRSDKDDPRYVSPETEHLSVSCVVTGGDGSAASPFINEVMIRNDSSEAWSGVIRADLHFEADSPRFFLPGFMYGTNRGEAPLICDSKAPRLRRGEPVFPASTWWMTRSDRLSHPAAFVFTGDRIEGLCAAPYFLKKDGRPAPWEPGVTGDWLQYTGFGCDIERNTVSFTLGYENLEGRSTQTIVDRPTNVVNINFNGGN